MRRFRPKTWSENAREMADFQIAQIVLTPEYASIEKALDFFSNSYRADIIKRRAAKRFGRWRRYNNTVYTKNIIKFWDK